MKGLYEIGVEVLPLNHLGRADCYFNEPVGLYVNDALLASVPKELIGDTNAILDDFRNETAWHLQRYVLGGAGIGGFGLLIASALWWRHKSKRKNDFA